MQINFLGIDPGIAATGYCLLSHSKQKQYQCIQLGTIKTDRKSETSVRLRKIYGEIECLVNDYLDAGYGFDGIVIERVFFSRNVSSAISTGKVIGIIELLAATYGIPVLLPTPQQIKQASGFGGKADKKQVKTIMSKLTKTEFKTFHEADACAAACYGILNHDNS